MEIGSRFGDQNPVRLGQTSTFPKRIRAVLKNEESPLARAFFLIAVFGIHFGVPLSIFTRDYAPKFFDAKSQFTIFQ